ncbi:MAG: hypothetical protein ACI8WB_002057 [Phenylobacterium sp.]|jgi:hypothetical protein
MKMTQTSTILFCLLTATILWFGWIEKDEYWYTAENGLGYAFGIIGCAMMLLLLLYPARKHYKPMRNLFKVHHWFRFHMIFGVWGPCFILLHSNFNLGSPNSTIALISMLLVAASGVIGRYVYQKLHRGLYGKQIEFSELDGDYQVAKQQFSQSPFYTTEVAQDLAQIEADLTQGLVPLRTSIRAKRNIGKIWRQSKRDKKHKQNNLKHWRDGLSKLTKIANYALYTRLFSLWHIFHLPIFFMMLITATVHIFVVHMY